MRKKVYEIQDVFGCPETISKDCPTFLERSVHKNFQNALRSKNIVVVYGESRQGKTWTIEKYCQKQCRIGCTNNMDLKELKEGILNSLGVRVQDFTYEREVEANTAEQLSLDLGFMPLATTGAKTSQAQKKTEKLSANYKNIDINKLTGYAQTIKQKLGERYLIFDNFHYLSPDVQKQFCSMLKEFNYQNIKVIIVGVWKEAAKITALAPDLGNRCKHIDIGMWDEKELKEVLKKGEYALNIKFSEEEIKLFCDSCANNIGIFKDFLESYCLKKEILKTQQQEVRLCDIRQAKEVVEEFVMQEAYNPLRDRIKNLSTPRKNKKDSKFMRLKIVNAILNLIGSQKIQQVREGIVLVDIMKEIDSICAQKGQEKLQLSNIVQELGLLHNREENIGAGENVIPLFYYDKANKKILVLEPLLYVLKVCNSNLLKQIADEISA